MFSYDHTTHTTPHQKRKIKTEPQRCDSPAVPNGALQVLLHSRQHVLHLSSGDHGQVHARSPKYLQITIIIKINKSINRCVSGLLRSVEMFFPFHLPPTHRKGHKTVKYPEAGTAPRDHRAQPPAPHGAAPKIQPGKFPARGPNLSPCSGAKLPEPPAAREHPTAPRDSSGPRRTA